MKIDVTVTIDGDKVVDQTITQRPEAHQREELRHQAWITGYNRALDDVLNLPTIYSLGHRDQVNVGQAHDAIRKLRK